MKYLFTIYTKTFVFFFLDSIRNESRFGYTTMASQLDNNDGASRKYSPKGYDATDEIKLLLGIPKEDIGSEVKLTPEPENKNLKETNPKNRPINRRNQQKINQTINNESTGISRQLSKQTPAQKQNRPMVNKTQRPQLNSRQNFNNQTMAQDNDLSPSPSRNKLVRRYFMIIILFKVNYFL